MISKCLKGSLLVIVLLSAVGLLLGCGSGNKGSSGDNPVQGPTKVGSESCTNTCHAVTKDETGTSITAAWANTTHTTVQGVQCEDCHGPASQHWGVGPIPFPTPQAAQCLTCHDGTRAGDKSGFLATDHANPNLVPDKTFSQIPTPVSTGKHIEECSVCHNANARFEFDIDGNQVKPNPNDLQNPQVSCGSCHDAHQPQQMVKIAQRTDPKGYSIFRKFVVNATGEQSDSGTSLAAILFQPNGAVKADGTVDPTRVVGTNNELSVERLCASCHTKGNYKNSQLSTHQNDTYSQWKNSAHGDRNVPAFAEFSANVQAYTNPNTGLPYTTNDLGHQSSYPIDMALTTFGTTANTTRNAGNNNFACFKCHNGIASISWQQNVQGTPDASVVFGDEPVTCVTCHDPHQNYAGQSKNVRKPVMITNYSTSSITIQGNVFLDKTPVPLDKTGNGTICIFCHQGRESGLTLYATKLAPGKNSAGSFFNPHYLGTGAMLWGVNGYEYTGKSYSANVPHQGANCPTCHMAAPTADNQNGGHTWVPNVASCNTSSCHGSFNAVAAKTGSASPNVDTYRGNFDTNNYTGDSNGASLSIAQSIQALQQKVIAALQTKGIFYNDLAYPYFFSDAASTSSFTAWTPATYKAAFNLSFSVKGLPSGATSQANVPNASAAVHNYKYIIQLLQDGLADLGAPLSATAVRPAGTRPATVYGPGQ
jgi:hypothetical protein